MDPSDEPTRPRPAASWASQNGAPPEPHDGQIDFLIELRLSRKAHPPAPFSTPIIFRRHISATLTLHRYGHTASVHSLDAIWEKGTCLANRNFGHAQKIFWRAAVGGEPPGGPRKMRFSVWAFRGVGDPDTGPLRVDATYFGDAHPSRDHRLILSGLGQTVFRLHHERTGRNAGALFSQST